MRQKRFFFRAYVISLLKHYQIDEFTLLCTLRLAFFALDKKFDKKMKTGILKC